MGKAKNESDSKSQVVSEICNISNQRISCSHVRYHRYPAQSPFLDWYLILRVDENAGIDSIRKQYLRLALQLHPDKNKHPKAEFAFKIVSEAYACLSDDARRTDFDLERKNISCDECRNGCYMRCNSSSTSNVKGRGISASERVRSDRILQRMKDLRARFVEEATVIENCLKANAAAASRVSSASRKELPIFNPTDYLHQGYPHQATGYNKMLQRENFRRYNSKKCVIQA